MWRDILWLIGSYAAAWGLLLFCLESALWYNWFLGDKGEHSRRPEEPLTARFIIVPVVTAYFGLEEAVQRWAEEDKSLPVIVLESLLILVCAAILAVMELVTWLMWMPFQQPDIRKEAAIIDARDRLNAKLVEQNGDAEMRPHSIGAIEDATIAIA